MFRWSLALIIVLSSGEEAASSFLEHAQAVKYSSTIFVNCGPELILLLVHCQYLPVDEFFITDFRDMVRMNGVAMSSIPGLSNQNGCLVML